MRGSSWVRNRCGYQSLGRHGRCLRHRRVTGRPKHVSSTSSTTGRSFTHARPEQFGHTGDSMLDSIVTTTWRSKGSGSATSTTFTAGRPSNRTHKPGVQHSRGSSDSTTLDTAKLAGPLLNVANPHIPLNGEGLLNYDKSQSIKLTEHRSPTLMTGESTED